MLRSQKSKAGSFVKTGAPTEAALKVFAEKVGVPDLKENTFLSSSTDKKLRATAASVFWERQYARQHMLEFDRHRKSMSVLAKGPGGEPFLFVKGAPESILERSVRASLLTH